MPLELACLGRQPMAGSDQEHSRSYHSRNLTSMLNLWKQNWLNYEFFQIMEREQRMSLNVTKEIALLKQMTVGPCQAL